MCKGETGGPGNEISPGHVIELADKLVQLSMLIQADAYATVRGRFPDREGIRLASIETHTEAAIETARQLLQEVQHAKDA